MAKYEIMLLVAGTLDEKKAKTVANDIASSIKQAKPTVEEYGLKELAYTINKNTHGYYFQYNFETDDTKLIDEFRRLCGINKNVLRNLIINLEKDYGYRATVNPKKIERNKRQAEIYAQKKSEYEKLKEARQAEFLAKKEIENDVTNNQDASSNESVEQEEKTKKTTTRSTKTKKSNDDEKVEKSTSTKTTTKKTTKKETKK